MSTLFTQYSPADYGAGSGLIWLGDAYTYAQVTGMWPNVRWSYLYSGYTAVGDVSDYSMRVIESSGTVMEDLWDSASGMYRSGCYWVSQTYHTGYYWTNSVSGGNSYVYSGGVLQYLTGVDQTFNINSGQTAFWNDGAGAALYNQVEGPYTLHYNSGIRNIIHSGTIGLYNLSAGSVPTSLQVTAFGFPTGYTLVGSGASETRLGAWETSHTYSGEPSEAWRVWTQDAAAIMEAYERTVQYNNSTPTSDNNYEGSVGRNFTYAKKFTIPPGYYFIPHGKIWFHSSVILDAQGAVFNAKFTPREDYGISPTWRSPFGEAKALVTIGPNKVILPDNSAKNSDIYLPYLRTYSPITETDGPHIGQTTGAAIRIGGLYNSRIHNMNVSGPVRYGIIFSPEGAGASFNEYNIGIMYGPLVHFKWRLRPTYSPEVIPWANDSIVHGGQSLNGSTGSYSNESWNPYTDPVVVFDAENDASNPNRDPREDYMYDVPTISTKLEEHSHQFDNPCGGFWFDNYSPEIVGISNFIRASGWTNMRFDKGRYEGISRAELTATSGYWYTQKSIIKGQVNGNHFSNILYGGNLGGLPVRYLGSGITFDSFDSPLPGMSARNKFNASYKKESSPLDRDWGKHRSVRTLTGDLYLQGPGSRILFDSEDGEVLKELYLDDIVSDETRHTVAKIRTIPRCWMKWKKSTDTDYTTDLIRIAPGDTLDFRFGDFSALPDEFYIRPYLKMYTTAGQEVVLALYTSSSREFINSHADIQKGRYIDKSITVTASGIIHPSIWIQGLSSVDYEMIDEITYYGKIEVLP